MIKTLKIAEEVNGMTDFQIRQRIKELRAIADSDTLCYDELVELNFLCLKILSNSK